MKYSSMLVALLLFAATFSSCKKENTEPKAKDYAASIKDKSWWGVFTYTGETSQYYTVHFNSDNTLTWSQLSGDYAGQWVITDKTIAFTVSGINVSIKAEISNDDNLVNISDNLSTLEINNGKLFTTAKLDLEHTVWKGTGLAGGGTSNIIQISFLVGFKAELKLNNTTYPPFSYQTSAYGRGFRIYTGGASQYFGVLITASEIKGSATASQFPFQLNKQ